MRIARSCTSVCLASSVLALSAVSHWVWRDITVAGATVPYPIYAKWAEATAENGRGCPQRSVERVVDGGIKQIRAKTVTSEPPMLAKAGAGQGRLIQFDGDGRRGPGRETSKELQPEDEAPRPLVADIYRGRSGKWKRYQERQPQR